MPEVFFNGPDGRLEGRYQHGRGALAPIALILHQHPHQGGTMNSKIVHLLFRAFTKRGFSTLRFNFRGVGRSQGVFSRGEGELADAAAAIDWLQTYNANPTRCWVAGVSFGAWIAMQLLMRRPEIERFIAISPPAGTQDFSFLAPCPSSGLIVQGAVDEMISVEAVQKLVNKLAHQRDLDIQFEVVPDANHLYTDRLEALGAIIDAYLDTALKTPPMPRNAR